MARERPEVRCPVCRNKVLTRPNQTSATCRCGTRFNTSTGGVFSPATSTGSPSGADSRKPKTAERPEVRCPACRNKVLTKPNQTSATCRCGTRFNTVTGGVISPATSTGSPSGADSRKPKTAERSEVRCPACRNKVLARPNQTSATCRCGTRFNTVTGGVISPVPSSGIPSGNSESNSSKQPQSAAKAGSGSDPMQELGKLGVLYPKIAEQLMTFAKNGHGLSGTLEETANRIFYLGQLWLVFLDGADFGLTRDRDIYNNIRDMAGKPPRCSIEEEAGAWMNVVAVSMTALEIKLALQCGVETVGIILEINGNFDDTLSALIETRDRSNPSMRGK